MELQMNFQLSSRNQKIFSSHFQSGFISTLICLKRQALLSTYKSITSTTSRFTILYRIYGQFHLTELTNYQFEKNITQMDYFDMEKTYVDIKK